VPDTGHVSVRAVGGNVSARIEVWLSSEARARCPVRLVVSLAPAPGAAGAARAYSTVLPARSQFVALPSPAAYTGRAELSASLVLSDDASARAAGAADTVLAEDARDVYILRCDPADATAQNRNKTRSSSSCCLAHGFVPTTRAGLSAVRAGARRQAGDDAAGVEPGVEHVSGRVSERGREGGVQGGDGGKGEGNGGEGRGGGTPRLAHFVFDVKGPPPRCSYFFFVAVRSAARVLRSEMGEKGGVVVHFHHEPWGPW